MSELTPEIGLVIRHAYLWWSEARAGREEASKDRPCVIIHHELNEYGETEVYIAPITHSPPEEPERAMEIPQATKKRLRLDDERSWIITTEVNRFIWPGTDIRSVPGVGAAYGPLPHAMTRALIERIRENERDKRLMQVGRDDDELLKQVRERRRSPRSKVDDRDR